MYIVDRKGAASGDFSLYMADLRKKLIAKLFVVKKRANYSQMTPANQKMYQYPCKSKYAYLPTSVGHRKRSL